MADSAGVRLGELAPEFCLRSATGEEVCLASFRGRSEVVVFFYPKDGTPGCTVEACSFRDAYEQFREAGAEVIGISADSAESHADFARRHRLPFLLLADPGGRTAKRYGVSKTLGLIPGRETFLIDRQGIIRARFASQIQASRHIKEMLRELERLRAGQSRGGLDAGRT